MDQATLLEEPETKPKKPEPIQLNAAHDHKIVVDALERRVDDLKKLAKKTDEEGYQREATVMTADALALEHHVLPAFRAQRELPLVTHQQLEKNIAAALKVPVYKAFDQLGDPKVIVTYDGIVSRRQRLLDHLTNRVALYVKDVAEEAYRQGMSAREQTAESMADRSIGTLRAQDE